MAAHPRIRVVFADPKPPFAAAAQRHATATDVVFAVATVVIAMHVILAADVVAAVAALLATPAAVAAFRAGERTARTLIAGFIGIAALAVGLATSIPALVFDGATATAALGAAATLAGGVLIVLAFREALRNRRRRVQLLAIPAVLVLAQWVVAPAVNAGLATHATHEASPAAATLGLRGARDVFFRAADGVGLRGWYVPGTDGGAVIVLHGAHDTRADTVRHVRMLARAGFAVLAYDARGHGQSGGRTNALGWGATDDLAGAVSFLRRQGIDDRRIGALGLSMGAESALRAAADGVGLRAVVADGAGASTLDDLRLTGEGGPIFTSVTWLAMRGTEAVSATSEPPALRDAIAGLGAPVLLVASGATHELAIDRAYRDAIGARASLWSVPDAQHTKALAAHPAAYAARVTRFLDRALTMPHMGGGALAPADLGGN